MQARTKIIPEPYSSRQHRLAQVLPVLAGNRQFKAQLRKLIKEILDTIVPFADQDPAKVEQFRLAALEMFPLLRRYDRAWPATLYARQYLWAANHEHRRQRIVAEERRTTQIEYSYGARSPERKRGDDGLSQVGRHGAAFREERVVRLHGSIMPSSGATLVPSPSVASSSDSENMATFLSSVTLSDLLPRFTAAGIQDLDCLLSLKKWPEDERIRFLQCDVELTMLESRMVNSALGSQETRKKCAVL